jgi:hypothetical protein
MYKFNLKIKEKIGNEYYFERDGKPFGPSFTKERIDKITQNMRSNNNPMIERKKLIDEYEKNKLSIKKEFNLCKQKEELQNSEGISHTTFYDAVIDSKLNNIHKSEFKKKIINSSLSNLYKVKSLGEIIKSNLGANNKNLQKFFLFRRMVLHPNWSLLFIAVIVFLIFKIFNVNLNNYIPKF